MADIYMNWAATAPNLSPAAARRVCEFVQGGPALSAGRGYEGLDDAGTALEARLGLAQLFGVKNPTQILFTAGATAAMNLILRGVLRRGDHVLATCVEHNAVARPLARLEAEGLISVTWLPCAPDGTPDPGSIGHAVRGNTRLLVMTHASNVLGTILPVEACFRAAKSYGLMTVLDAAQTAGNLPVTMGAHTDAIVFTGHKGLRGLAGVGGFAITPQAAAQMQPWWAGGTGSMSHLLTMPDALPDRFEPGTYNAIGIVSLAAAVTELLALDVTKIAARERALTQRFLDGAAQLPLTVYGTRDAARSVPVVSVSAPGQDCGVLAHALHERFAILTRSGLHCAPLAHRTMGTYPAGTVRLSFGRDTTEQEVDAALVALDRLL